MQIFSTPGSLIAYISKARIHNQKVGLVPTMGAIHHGHLELIAASTKSNDVTICSIYVNPIQFNDKQDLIDYPRDLEKDIEKLTDAGCTALFCPADEDMYPEKPTLTLDFGELEKVLEGRFRPGHFKGVALVVAKLLNIARPDSAYFGEKDWQQLIIINRLVQNLSFQIEIVGVPIIREPDGLAVSSRNRRLTPVQRKVAPELYHTMKLVADHLKDSTSIDSAKEYGRNYLSQFPDINLEYLEVVRSTTLDGSLGPLGSETLSICIAAFLDQVRLIDNIKVFEN